MAYFKFSVKPGGPTYEFDPSRDITLQSLRSIKGWYGKELGSFNALNTAFGAGDPEAIASVLWICRRNAGEKNVPEPKDTEDFRIGDFYNSFEFVPDADDPFLDGSDQSQDQTDDLTQTPTNYGDDTSG